MPNHVRLREPKACLSCAQAKVKCQVETPDGCNRCLRLNKTCRMQPPGAHKRKTQGQSSDVSRLERKLDDMNAIFTATSQRLLGVNFEKDAAHDAQRQSQSSDPLEFILPNDEDGLRSIWSFRNELVPSFPSVVVPVDMTVSELRRKKPFLLSTIAMVTCYDDAARQLEMVRIIKQHISTAIVLKEDISFDLLQGLLVCLSWYHLQIPLGVQIGNLLHLTMSMMVDLGLHRKSGPATKIAPLTNNRHTSKRSTYRSLDERRAYLGCYYINCVVAMYLMDMDPMRYTAYTEECCRIVEDAAQYPSDQYLVKLVQMHRITDRINHVLTFDQYHPTEPIFSAPVGMCIKVLEADLRQIKDSITPTTLNDTFLLMHYHALELRLYEIALDNDSSTERYGNCPVTRLNILYSCLVSAKAFFDAFSSIQLPDYFKIPYPVYASFMHALGVLSRLLLYSGDNWDREYARSIIDFPTAIEISVGKLEEVVKCYGNASLPYKIPAAYARVVPRVTIMREIHELRRTALESKKESDGRH